MDEADGVDVTHPVQARERHRATLLGTAIGDAMGAAFEGTRRPSPETVAAHLAATELRRYTDDTVLSVAAAESLLHCGGVDQDHLARSFVAAWERDPARGYGAGTAELLSALGQGGSWLVLAPAQFGGEGSFGNGAAMRSAPIALFAAGDPRRAAWLAHRAAVVTHTHPDATAAAALHAAAVAHLAAGGSPAAEAIVGAVAEVGEIEPLSSVLDQVLQTPARSTPIEVAQRFGNGVAARESVPAALAVFSLNASSFTATVDFAIQVGGDTDTIASMAGALAGAHLGMDAIPEAWASRVEGCARLTEIASRFQARWPLA